MVEEDSPTETTVETPKEQVNIQELMETYDFFGNSIKANITLYNGMKLILEKITKIEEQLNKLETLYGNKL